MFTYQREFGVSIISCADWMKMLSLSANTRMNFNLVSVRQGLEPLRKWGIVS